MVPQESGRTCLGRSAILQIIQRTPFSWTPNQRQRQVSQTYVPFLCRNVLRRFAAVCRDALPRCSRQPRSRLWSPRSVTTYRGSTPTFASSRSRIGNATNRLQRPSCGATSLNCFRIRRPAASVIPSGGSWTICSGSRSAVTGQKRDTKPHSSATKFRCDRVNRLLTESDPVSQVDGR